jgi:hypothetical protein
MMNIPTSYTRQLAVENEELRQQRDELLAACEKTISENQHLADGDDCTLIDIKRAVEGCKP